MHSVGVTTQQDARVQLVKELIGDDDDAVQSTEPVAEVLLHSVDELVLSRRALQARRRRLPVPVVVSPCVGRSCAVVTGRTGRAVVDL